MEEGLEEYKKEVLEVYWEEGLEANRDQLVKREWVVQVLRVLRVVIQGANHDQLVRKEWMVQVLRVVRLLFQECFVYGY